MHAAIVVHNIMAVCNDIDNVNLELLVGLPEGLKFLLMFLLRQLPLLCLCFLYCITLVAQFQCLYTRGERYTL